jgi:hypothetical protein
MTRSATMLVLLFAACAPAAKALQPSSRGGFFSRIFTFYHPDWTGTAPDEPAPARRGQPSPLPSPPYPSEDWSYGGSPVIGEPDGNSYQLMQGINENRQSQFHGRSRHHLPLLNDPSTPFLSSRKEMAPLSSGRVLRLLLLPLTSPHPLTCAKKTTALRF